MSEQKTGAPSGSPPATQPTDIKRRDRYQVYPAYRDIDQATAEAPYLVAPKTDSDADTKMTIANLCLTPPATPLTSPEVGNDDFRFDWVLPDSRARPINADDVKVFITIKKAKNVWRASIAARQALPANFVSFCTQVEALEQSKKLLVGGGAMVIVQRVAEALPVPIGDSLLYRAGFNPSDAVGFWDMTNRQDWQVVELTQLGVRSDVFTPGPYSLEEDLLAAFDREYLQVMGV